MADIGIRVEYTGVDPDIKPAAHTLARMIKNAINADGTFADPELETKFQEWMKQEAEKACNKNAPLMLEPSTGRKGLFA